MSDSIALDERQQAFVQDRVARVGKEAEASANRELFTMEFMAGLLFYCITSARRHSRLVPMSELSTEGEVLAVQIANEVAHEFNEPERSFIIGRIYGAVSPVFIDWTTAEYERFVAIMERAGPGGTSRRYGA